MRSGISGLVLALGLAVLLAPTATAAVTTASIVVGGPNSRADNGTSDPGVLSDGLTEASALFSLTLDNESNVLELRVENTSPVLPGVPNPILTEIFLNAPVPVESLRVLSQSGSGGRAPAFAATFDWDLFLGTNPNQTGAFGDFSLRLDNGPGLAGGIANANADTWAVPQSSLVLGPAVFVFQLVGDLSQCEASYFVQSFSQTEGGVLGASAAARFEGAGAPMDASGLLSDGTLGCNPLVFLKGELAIGSEIRLILSGRQGCHGCLIVSSGCVPTFRSGVLFDIGPDLQPILPLAFAPSSYVTFSFTVPDLPQLVGARVGIQWVAADLSFSNIVILKSPGLCLLVTDKC